MIDRIPTVAIALLVFVVVMGASEAGYRYAVSRRGKEDPEQLGVIEGAAFGLVALLLGFSFSLANGHYDARRQMVVTEANSIGTTMLRAETLTPPAAAAMKADIQRYINVRIDYALADADPEAREVAGAETTELQNKMWAIAESELKHDPRSTVTPLFVDALNDTINTSGEEAAVLANDIPKPVFAILTIVLIAAATLLGYGFAKSKSHLVSRTLFALMLALVVAIILDLDRAQRGYIRVSLAPLRALQTPISPLTR